MKLSHVAVAAISVVFYWHGGAVAAPSHEQDPGPVPSSSPVDVGAHPAAEVPAVPSFEEVKALLDKLAGENQKNLADEVHAQAAFQTANAAHTTSKDLSNPIVTAAEGKRLIDEANDLIRSWLNDPDFKNRLESDADFRQLVAFQAGNALALGETGRWLTAYQEALNEYDQKHAGKADANPAERKRYAAETLSKYYPGQRGSIFSDRALVAKVIPLKATLELYKDLFPSSVKPETLKTRLDYFQGQVPMWAKMAPKDVAFWEAQFKVERDPQEYPKKVAAAYEAFSKKREKALPLLAQVYGNYLKLKKDGVITGQRDPKTLTPEQLEKQGSLVHNTIGTLYLDLLNRAPQRLKEVADKAQLAAQKSAVARQRQKTPEEAQKAWAAAGAAYNEWLQTMRSMVDEQQSLDNGLLLAATAELENRAAQIRKQQLDKAVSENRTQLEQAKADLKEAKGTPIETKAQAVVQKLEQAQAALESEAKTPMPAGDALLQAATVLPQVITPQARKGYVLNDDILYPEGSAATAGSSDFDPASIEARVKQQRSNLDSLLSSETPAIARFHLVSGIVDTLNKSFSPDDILAVGNKFGGGPSSTPAAPKRLRGTPPLTGPAGK